MSPDLLRELREHGDVLPQSVCIALEDGQAAGVAYLIRHATALYRGRAEAGYLHGVYFARPGTENEVGISEALLDDLKTSFRIYADRHPGRPLALRLWCRASDPALYGFLTEKGFHAGRLMTEMVRKLDADMGYGTGNGSSREDCFPEGFSVEEPVFDEAFSKEYRRVNGRCFGVPDSMEELRFMRSLGARVFSVMKNDAVPPKLAASVTVWRVSDRRAATENIFCAPAFRRRGLTTALLTRTFELLREAGYEEAILTLFSDNEPAFRLYRSLGYETTGFLMEMLYEEDYHARPY